MLEGVKNFFSNAIGGPIAIFQESVVGGLTGWIANAFGKAASYFGADWLRDSGWMQWLRSGEQTKHIANYIESGEQAGLQNGGIMGAAFSGINQSAFITGAAIKGGSEALQQVGEAASGGDSPSAQAGTLAGLAAAIGGGALAGQLLSGSTAPSSSAQPIPVKASAKTGPTP